MAPRRLPATSSWVRKDLRRRNRPPLTVDDLDLAARFDRIADELARTDDLDEALERICSVATRAVDRCEHAGVSLLTDDGLTSPELADSIAVEIDQLQVRLDEGPCLEALQSGISVSTDDLADDPRWPRLAREVAARSRVRSVLSEHLTVGGRRLGALNLYSSRPAAFTDDDGTVSAILAAYAGMALLAGRERRQFRTALASRDVIGQAKGILMARLGCDEDTAFHLLRANSMRLNRKLHEVASDVVDEQRLRGADPVGRAADDPRHDPAS